MVVKTENRRFGLTSHVMAAALLIHIILLPVLYINISNTFKSSAEEQFIGNAREIQLYFSTPNTSELNLASQFSLSLIHFDGEIKLSFINSLQCWYNSSHPCFFYQPSPVSCELTLTKYSAINNYTMMYQIIQQITGRSIVRITDCKKFYFFVVQ